MSVPLSIFGIIFCFFNRLAFFAGKLELRGMLLDRFGKDTYMVTRIETGNDDTVAFFGKKSGGETLIAAGALALERIETDGVHRLDALAQALLDAGEVFLEFGAERLQILQVSRDKTQ